MDSRLIASDNEANTTTSTSPASKGWAGKPACRSGGTVQKVQKLKKITQNTTGYPELNVRPTKIWKNVAVAELEARERAEEEFQQLVVAVTARAKLIDDVTRITRKRIARAPRIRKATRSQPPDSSLCAAFLRDLEVNYTQPRKSLKTPSLCQTHKERGSRCTRIEAMTA
ncbi:hypothetical protein GQ600_10732 [Phytophthora cactorum]|nr:hypothetical protein GQ600_10732 [Phytophthora cactorum]